MSLKFKQFATINSFRVINTLKEFKKNTIDDKDVRFSQEQKIAMSKFFKLYDSQIQLSDEKILEIRNDESLSEEDKNKSLLELSECESELVPAIDYNAIKIVDLSYNDIISIKDMIINLPEEFK